MDYTKPSDVDEHATIIDVRSPSEYNAAHIPNSYNVPLDRLDEFKRELRSVNGVLVCRTDNRSSEAWKILRGSGADVSVLENGINAWQDAERELVYGETATWSIQRQVQFIAGSMTLLGIGLNALFSPWFLLIPGFIGSGLTYAGLTGTCGMAGLLRLAPWNQTGSNTEEHIDELKSMT